MKKINDNIFKRAVNLLLLLSLVVVLAFVPINDTSAAEATAGLKVNATSNYFPTASVTVDEGEAYVTVTYFINSPKDMLNVQWTLTYDPAYLEFVEADNMNAANNSNLMPMVDDLVWNADGKNYMKANASDLELYKFAGKGLVPFITVTFQVIGSGETDVDLNVEVLTLSLPDSDTQMTDSKQEELVIHNGVVDEAKVHTGRETSVDAGLYNPGYNVKVSNEEDIIAALNNGVYKIKLTEDITLSGTLDLSDKMITLDLNGHVLTGNIKLADNSGTAVSTLYLIDSSTASDGVLDGKIDLTGSCLYANGGTVTGLVSMNDSASKIFCTSDTPTAFNGNVGNFGEIHGGIFYGDINISCIKEKYITFLNGEETYAYEVVSSDNNTVAPVEPDQTKYGYQNFDGWYNGEAAYAFGSSLSEDITLTAKKQHTLTKTEQRAPTCTAAGMEAYWTCSVCGKHFADEKGNTEVADLADLTIAMADHTWDAGKVTKEPTAIEEGEKTFTCGVCGITRIEVIPAAANSTTETPAVTVTPAEVQENSMKLNTGTSMVWKKDKLTISWKTISGADGYDIFAVKCGAKMTSKSLVKTVKGKKSSAALTKIAGRKLSGKEEYKVRIKAYKLINSKKVYIGSSQFYHMAGKNNKTFTNAKKITVSKKSVTLKVGKTSRIKAKIVKQSNKKKLLPKGHGAALRYCSTDNSIATVTANGKITAKGKGSCYIYVIALNGVKTKIKVKVK